MRDELGNNIHCVDKIGDRTGIPFYLPIRLRIYNAIYFDCKNYLWEVKIYRMDFQKFFYIFTIHIRNVSEKFARYTIEYKIYSTWSSSSSSLYPREKILLSLVIIFILPCLDLPFRYNVKSCWRERGGSHRRRMVRFNSVVSRLETKLKQKHDDERYRNRSRSNWRIVVVTFILYKRGYIW